MNNSAFWDAATSGLSKVNRHFGGNMFPSSSRDSAFHQLNAGSLLAFFFGREYGGDMSLRNVG
jgi:hypothetical protein